MEIRFDSSQDITLRLSGEESSKLVQLSEPTKNFFDLHISSERSNPKKGGYYILFKGLSEELESFLFLGYSRDFPIYGGYIIHDIEDEFGKIGIPVSEGEPWLVNLSSEGIKQIKEGLNKGVRYNGSNKLFIILQT